MAVVVMGGRATMGGRPFQYRSMTPFSGGGVATSVVVVAGEGGFD